MTLDQIRKRAKRTAENDGKPVVIMNLNRVGSPMYVVRSISADQREAIAQSAQFVEFVEPGSDQ